MIRLRKSPMFITIYFILMTTLFLSGCAGFSKKDTSAASTVLTPSAIHKFDDIPVPNGFKLVPSDSYTFKSGDIRVGVLVYSGKAAADQLATFYQDQMPLNNWNFLNIIEYGKRMLNFDRENESCVISIEPKMFSTRVIISIGPKQQTPKKVKEPVK